MRIRGGYILQPRAIDQSEIIHESPIVRELWLYVLRKVNHQANGQYDRGQGFFNLSEIAEDLHWWVGYRKMKYSKPQLAKSLRRLRERNMIATAKATRGMLITVCKYDYYQNPKNYESNNEGTAKETRRKREGHTKNKNDKNDNNDNTLFEKFWDMYSKKVGREKCELKWKEIKDSDKEIIFKVVPDYVKSTPVLKYRKNPLTYLNGQCWNDDIIFEEEPAKQQEPKFLN